MQGTTISMALKEPTTTMETKNPELELIHPDDAEYIWLPIAVLLGILVLAALVYAMSRSRSLSSIMWCCKCKSKNNRRNGYLNVDNEDDSDVSMVCGDEFGEHSATACLLSGRLQIDQRPLGPEGSHHTHQVTA